jgi:membrane protein YqaA with SNARE-associated domain
LAKKHSLFRDLVVGLGVIIVIYAIGLLYGQHLLEFLKSIPVLDELLLFLEAEVENRSVLGLGIITLLGGLFFIGYPAELLFLLYVRLGYGILLVSFVMIVYTMAAQVVNYGMGYYIEKKFLHLFVKSRESDFLQSLKKYDMFFIVIINILPLPADLFTVFLGMIKYDFKKTMKYTLYGKILKYVFLGLLVLLSRISF